MMVGKGVSILFSLAVASTFDRICDGGSFVVDAFTPAKSSPAAVLPVSYSTHHLVKSVPLWRRPQTHPKSRIALQLAKNNGNSPYSFDVSRPTFDLFTLRSIRGDALLQYNTLNQSEPLRINLYLLLTLSLFAFPAVSEAVLGDSLSLPGTAASAVGGLGSFGLFLRECGRRSRQLIRIEKELDAEFLTLRLPSNRFADRPVGKVAQLRDIRGVKRVLAICGSKDQLSDALVQFRVLRRRFAQAAVIVVAVPTDGSKLADWGVRDEEVRSAPFLAEAQGVEEWLEYFRSLQYGDKNEAEGEGKECLVWFGLNNNGRSFASGAGEPPRLIEVLGQNLRPVEVLDEDDAAEDSATADKTRSQLIANVLEAQTKFYDALTSGDLTSMKSICSKDGAAEVSEVMELGGRIDNWETCLAEDARPSGMVVSGADVLVVSDTEAYSTAIEFPPNAGVESATLLAVQQWGRDTGGDWKLKLHQTIPWSTISKAGGTLRCDCRGCVALTRGKDRRTFGGLIG